MTNHNTTDPYAAQVTAQAIEFLYRNIPGVIITITLMPLVAVLVMWEQIDHALLLGWWLVAMLVTTVRLLLNRAYLRNKPSLEKAAHWGWYYTATALASGAVWGAAGYLFFVPESQVHQIFLYTCIVGLCAGALVLNAYWLASYYAFVIPALTLTAARMFVEGGVAFQGLAVLSLMLIAMLLQVAHQSRQSALASIRLRFENIDLIERLAAEKDKADAANREKTRFLASASHDLRQPVHALTLFATALRSEQSTPRGITLLNDMGHSIEALHQLLASLIDISKLDAGIVTPSAISFQLAPLLQRLSAEYQPQAEVKGLTWSVDTTDAAIISDPVLFETMFRNLISNAIRYTTAGDITISCAEREHEIAVSVTDTGIGIPPERHRDVFREFFQLGNPERDRSQGLGLGLAIVERLASLLGHRVELESELGKGSRFTIIAPQANAMGVAMPVSENLSAAPTHDLAGLRILVVDDESAIRKGMQALLDGWGCTTLLASDVEEAVKLLEDAPPPDVVLADYRLRGGKTGVEAIARLTRQVGYPIPTLLITGDTAPDRIREAQASGHTLMHKPIQPGKLAAYLRRLKFGRTR